MAECSLTYTLNCADVEVRFDFNKGYPATWEEPGCSDEIEINEVIYKGVNILPCISEEDCEAMYSYIDTYKAEEDV